MRTWLFIGVIIVAICAPANAVTASDRNMHGQRGTDFHPGGNGAGGAGAGFRHEGHIDFRQGEHPDFRRGEQMGFREGEHPDFRRGEQMGFREGEHPDFRRGEQFGFRPGERADLRRGEGFGFQPGEHHDFSRSERPGFRPAGYPALNSGGWTGRGVPYSLYAPPYPLSYPQPSCLYFSCREAALACFQARFCNAFINSFPCAPPLWPAYIPLQVCLPNGQIVLIVYNPQYSCFGFWDPTCANNFVPYNVWDDAGMLNYLMQQNGYLYPLGS